MPVPLIQAAVSARRWLATPSAAVPRGLPGLRSLALGHDRRRRQRARARPLDRRTRGRVRRRRRGVRPAGARGTAGLWLLNHAYLAAQVGVVPAALIRLYRRDRL